MKTSASCGQRVGREDLAQAVERMEERRADPGEREQQLAEGQQRQQDEDDQIGSRRNFPRQYQ